MNWLKFWVVLFKLHAHHHNPFARSLVGIFYKVYSREPANDNEPT